VQDLVALGVLREKIPAYLKLCGDRYYAEKQISTLGTKIKGLNLAVLEETRSIESKTEMHVDLINMNHAKAMYEKRKRHATSTLQEYFPALNAAAKVRRARSVSPSPELAPTQAAVINLVEAEEN
jgi:hypothetical protein